MSKKPRVDRYVMPTSGNQEQRITQALFVLFLDGMAPVFKKLVRECLNSHATYLDFLESLLDAQIVFEEDKRIPAQIAQAKFSLDRSVESYDFSEPRKIDEPKIRELASCRFIDESESIMFLGPTGVGKSHLAVALGKKAIEYGKKVKFFKFNKFIELLQKNTTNELTQQRNLIKSFTNIDLLILDDIEYYQLSPEVSNSLYMIMLDRYEKGASTILTANESFSAWGAMFGSQIRAEKVSDRAHERSHIIIIEGDSHRIKDKLKTLAQIVA